MKRWLSVWDAGLNTFKSGRHLIESQIAEAVATRMTKSADGWAVRGDDRSVVMKSRDGAVSLIAKAVLAEQHGLVTTLKRLAGLLKAVEKDLDPDRQKLIRDLLSEQRYDDDVKNFGVHRALQNALREDEADLLQTHMGAGSAAGLDDPNANADPELTRQFEDWRKRNLVKYGYIDGARITSNGAVKKLSRGSRFI